MFKSKGVNLRVTPKDVETRVLNFCKEVPYGGDKDISEHFVQMADVFAVGGI